MKIKIHIAIRKTNYKLPTVTGIKKDVAAQDAKEAPPSWCSIIKFFYIMTKKLIKGASADVGLIFVAYNLSRMLSVLGKVVFKSYLKQLWLYLSFFSTL
jgi:hypothetical protein